MPTWQYFSDIETDTREQRIYRHPSDTHSITLTRHKGLRARAATADRSFDIRGHGNFLWPRFSLVEQDRLLWTLLVRSPLRNVHTLDTAAAGPWQIKTPFFNSRVSGQSGEGASLEVMHSPLPQRMALFVRRHRAPDGAHRRGRVPASFLLLPHLSAIGADQRPDAQSPESIVSGSPGPSGLNW